jgi:hypothetical protein
MKEKPLDIRTLTELEIELESRLDNDANELTGEVIEELERWLSWTRKHKRAALDAP